MVGPIRRWPGGVVPYIISGSSKHPDHCKISKERQYKIKAAMVDIERVANVKFRHATPSDDDYIDIGSVLYCTVLYCTVLYCTLLYFFLYHIYF